MSAAEVILPPVSREAFEEFRKQIVERLRDIERTRGHDAAHDKVEELIEELTR